MARTRSSRQWLREHFTDAFVQRAWKEGYRSRAVYKLKEIDGHDRLLQGGLVVVDLGAAPGGWAQYARERVGPSGCVIAVDLLPIMPMPGVEILEGDFTKGWVLAQIVERLAGRPPGLVISDMAPNISGIGPSDQARAMYLAELALDFAIDHLAPEGACLIKTFQGAGFPELLQRLRRHFAASAVRKPEASRSRSAEVYLLGRGRKA